MLFAALNVCFIPEQVVACSTVGSPANFCTWESRFRELCFRIGCVGLRVCCFLPKAHRLPKYAKSLTPRAWLSDGKCRLIGTQTCNRKDVKVE